MLTIQVATADGFDEGAQEFTALSYVELNLEHSLAALSKWESFFEKPFLSDEVKSKEETLKYIEFMDLGKTPGEIFQKVTQDDLNLINDYINARMSATWFRSAPQTKRRKEVITSELIYYWMASFNIPFECENWHLNRLLTLIQVCNLKNSPEKKMSREEMLAERKRLNEERKNKINTSG